MKFPTPPADLMEPAPSKLQDLSIDEPVTLSSLIKAMFTNYGIYFETKEKLDALQEWVKTQEKIYNER